MKLSCMDCHDTEDKIFWRFSLFLPAASGMVLRWLTFIITFRGTFYSPFSNFNHNHQTLSVDVLLVERDQSQPPAGRSSDTTGSKLRDICSEGLKFLKCYCFFFLQNITRSMFEHRCKKEKCEIWRRERLWWGLEQLLIEMHKKSRANLAHRQPRWWWWWWWRKYTS